MLYLLTLASVTLTMLFGASGSCTGSPAEDLRRAESLIQAGDCDGALKVLGDVSDADFLPKSLQMMANCHKRLGRWNDAISSYERLLSLPDSPVPAKDVSMWLMDCHLAHGDSDKALSLLRELLTKYPGDAWRFHHAVGRRYFWQHRYDPAISALAKAVALGTANKNDPDYADARSQLTNSYIATKQWKNAEKSAYDFARDYPDREWEWRCALGRCCSGQGRNTEAIEHLTKALSCRESGRPDETTKTIGKTLIECYFAVGRLDQAMLLVRSLEKDYPSEAATWQHVLGRTYLANGEYDKAASCFANVIQSSHERWEIRSSQIYRGECLHVLGRGEEAIKAITDYYAERRELRAEYLLVHGAVLYHAGKDYDKAAQLLQQLISDFDGGTDAYGQSLVGTAMEVAAACLEKTGRWEEAAICLEGLAATQRGNGTIWCRIGDDYFQGEKYEAAKKAYRRSLDLPESTAEVRAKAMYQQALCYKKQGFDNSAERLAIRVSELYPDTEAAQDARGALYIWRGMPDADAPIQWQPSGDGT